MTDKQHDWKAWARDWIDRGFPWCDTCRRPAVFSEGHGMLHADPEHPFGIPSSLDPGDHDVTMREWWSR